MEAVIPGGKTEARRAASGALVTAFRSAFIAALAAAWALCACACAGGPPSTRQPLPEPPPSQAAATSPYVRNCIENFSRRNLANGAVLALMRRPGKSAAAARVAFARGTMLSPRPKPGLEAMALALATRGARGQSPAQMDAAFEELGARLELKLENYDDVALEISCPAESLARALELVGASLLDPDFSPQEFERLKRSFLLARWREAGDPLLGAGVLLRAAAYGDHPYTMASGGDRASIESIDLDEVKAFWSERVGAERLFIAAAADLDPDGLSASLAAGLGAIPRRAASAPPAPPPLSPRRLLQRKDMPGGGMTSFVRAEFSAPPADSDDFAALAVGLAMFDDLCSLRIVDRGLAYSSWTRLSPAAASSLGLAIYRCFRPAAARQAAMDAAFDIASGRCLDLAAGDGSLGPMENGIASYKAGAIVSIYGKGSSAPLIAARVARDLSAGGDGLGFFRLADAIDRVDADSVARVTRAFMVDGPSAWLALGSPAIVADFGE